jgi:hypothetical protein
MNVISRVPDCLVDEFVIGKAKDFIFERSFGNLTITGF